MPDEEGNWNTALANYRTEAGRGVPTSAIHRVRAELIVSSLRLGRHYVNDLREASRDYLAASKRHFIIGLIISGCMAAATIVIAAATIYQACRGG